MKYNKVQLFHMFTSLSWKYESRVGGGNISQQEQKGKCKKDFPYQDYTVVPQIIFTAFITRLIEFKNKYHI